MADRPMAVTVEGLSHEGRGLVRVDGKVGFVAGALPNERVEAQRTRRRARHDEYRLLRVHEPAPERVVPRCPLVGRCGGCDLQHLEPAAQLRHKSRVVAELLQRQANLVPDAVDDPIVSPPYGYRRRARLAVRMPRRGGGLVVGFRAAGGHDIVPVEVCAVLVPALQALPAALQQALPLLERPDLIGHVALSLSEAPGGMEHPVVHCHVVGALSPDDLKALQALGVEHGAYVAVQERDGQARLLHRPAPVSPGYLLPSFDLRIAYAGGDFTQANAVVNRGMVDRVVRWLGDVVPEGRVLDAFAGLGNFSLPLARSGARVLGVEADAGMVSRAQGNGEANHVEGATFQRLDLEAPETLGKTHFDAAVLDPTRAGARPLVSWLARRKVKRILYVSCAPATLARDAALLEGAGYRLARLALADMFPQTSHIEAMTLFSRRARAAPVRGATRRHDRTGHED